MCSLPFNRQQLRRTAAVLLAAWVFGLCSGAVQACLLPAAAVDGLPAAFVTSQTIAAPARARLQEPAQHGHPAAGHEDSEPVGGSGKEACFRFCVDESSALTKGKTSPADLPESLPQIDVCWLRPELTARHASWQQVERPAWVGPPLFLYLLRLTI